jgi:hypothetical protein
MSGCGWRDWRLSTKVHDVIWFRTEELCDSVNKGMKHKGNVIVVVVFGLMFIQMLWI